jgi:Icc-related predicted phosphoesterase
LDCIFVSDIHGKTIRYEKLFQIIKKEKPDGVFFGGDLLPNQFIDSSIDIFIKKHLFSEIKKIKNSIKKEIRFFIILGNDDPRYYEKLFLSADRKKLINYVHNKTVDFEEFFVTGYAYVPPTPFQLKDWEKYDVSRFVDVGAVSPETGVRTIEISEEKIRDSTIAEDLENLSEKSPSEKAIFLFHSPPYNSYLDRAALDDKKVDHAPFDVHIGSIAIQRFINTKQPLLTLHGHAHESARLTGRWMQKIGNTYCFSAAYDGPNLALVRFDTAHLQNATREIILLS